MPYIKTRDMVFLYEEQPKSAWTIPEWEAELNRLRVELAGLEEELSRYTRPEGWPEEALRLWDEVHGPAIGDLEFRIQDIRQRLTEMERL